MQFVIRTVGHNTALIEFSLDCTPLVGISVSNMARERDRVKARERLILTLFFGLSLGLERGLRIGLALRLGKRLGLGKS